MPPSCLTPREIARIADRVWGCKVGAEPWHGDVERMSYLVAAAVLRKAIRVHRYGEDNTLLIEDLQAMARECARSAKTPGHAGRKVCR